MKRRVSQFYLVFKLEVLALIGRVPVSCVWIDILLREIGPVKVCSIKRTDLEGAIISLTQRDGPPYFSYFSFSVSLSGQVLVNQQLVGCWHFGWLLCAKTIKDAMRSKGRRKTNQFNHRLQAPHKLVSAWCANQDLHRKKRKKNENLFWLKVVLSRWNVMPKWVGSSKKVFAIAVEWEARRTRKWEDVMRLGKKTRDREIMPCETLPRQSRHYTAKAVDDAFLLLLFTFKVIAVV